MSRFAKCASAALLMFAAACQPKTTEPTAEEAASSETPDLAAAASTLPVAHILLGKLTAPAGEESFSITNIKPILNAPTYQNQPTFYGADQAQLYFVAGNENNKTDLWSYNLVSGERSQITNTLEKSEFSPKPAPDGGVSYIQESEDGEMTRVHALSAPGEAGAAVIETGPVGYYEWLQSGASVAVFFRSEPPALQLVDVASGEAREIFLNVGRILLASPDGETLFATRADDAGQYEIVAADAASGATESLLDLPPGAQDFFLTFGPEGLPAVAYSSAETRLMTFDLARDDVWHVAADIAALGYGSITRVAVSNAIIDGGSRQIVFVAHPRDE